MMQQAQCHEETKLSDFGLFFELSGKNKEELKSFLLHADNVNTFLNAMFDFRKKKPDFYESFFNLLYVKLTNKFSSDFKTKFKEKSDILNVIQQVRAVFYSDGLPVHLLDGEGCQFLLDYMTDLERLKKEQGEQIEKNFNLKIKKKLQELKSLKLPAKEKAELRKVELSKLEAKKAEENQKMQEKINQYIGFFGCLTSIEFEFLSRYVETRNMPQKKSIMLCVLNEITDLPNAFENIGRDILFLNKCGLLSEPVHDICAYIRDPNNNLYGLIKLQSNNGDPKYWGIQYLLDFCFN